MTWLSSFGLAVLTAVCGCMGAAVLGAVCARWYRVTSFEGASGYYVVGIALLGLVGGFFLGLVTSRFASGFWRALGFSVGSEAGLFALIALFAWLGADFPPKLDGKELVVEVEVRLPEGLEPPKKEEQGYGWNVTITADTGARHQNTTAMDVEKARREDGRWIVPASVFLGTSDPGKSLGVTLGNLQGQFLRFPLPGRPTRADMQWSAWLTEATTGDLKPVPAERAAAVRYRVQPYVPEPPAPPLPSEEERAAKKKAEEDAAYGALTPDSPIEDWLRFTRYGQDEGRREAAAAAIARRPDVVAGLSPLVRSDDRDTSDLALRAIALMKEPPEGLGPAVADVGRSLADEIRAVNATKIEDDPGYQKAAFAEVRFFGWAEAARVLHGRPGVDMLPAMREIEELAKVRTESYVMREVARVSGRTVTEWSARTR